MYIIKAKTISNCYLVVNILLCCCYKNRDIKYSQDNNNLGVYCIYTVYIYILYRSVPIKRSTFKNRLSFCQGLDDFIQYSIKTFH